MNPNDGHLISEELLEQIRAHFPERAKLYEVLPPKLETAAQKKLAGSMEAHVSLTSGGKLSGWAAKRRKARKQAKKSRKRNRRA